MSAAIGPVAARIADGGTAADGDLVVTRRNDRILTTDHGEPVRNRERWTVAAVHDDGALTVSHLGRHGSVTLPADYVRAHVQLGYAATAHGHQGDTVDISITLVTAATTHRSLYVGATRGRDENPDVKRIERELRSARLRYRFDQLERQPPSGSLGRAPLGR